MSSKVTKKINKTSDVIKCKNCRQDILKDKMFLHEGFCSRNNVYCEHCEKVFLKKDYEEHVKLFKNSLTNKESNSPTNSLKSKETQSETFKPSSFTEENDNLSNTIPLAPKPSLEIVQMPITELYKINAPIFVNETGQIVSDKNKSENILPFLGLNFRSSKMSEKILDDIIEQGDIFKENNTISQNCYDFQGLRNIVNKNIINSKTINNSLIINTANNLLDLRNSDSSFGSLNIHKNNSSIYNNSIINSLNPSTSRTIEINKVNLYNNENKENIPNNSKPLNKRFNTLYINKSKANHSQTIFKKKYNLLTFQQTPQKVPTNSIRINSSLKRSEKISMPLDNASRRTPKRSNDNSIDDNKHYHTFKKEPKDSNSKKHSYKNSYKFSRFNYQDEINEYSEINNNENTKYIYNRFDTHAPLGKFKKTKSTRIFDIPRPKRKEKKQYSEAFILEDIDEYGLDEKKRQTLAREFNASTLNVISLNCEKKSFPGFITNPYKYNSLLEKDKQKLSLKKKLFQGIIEEKDEKKNYPEDSIREEKNLKKKSKLFRRINNLSSDINLLEQNNNEETKNKISKNSKKLIKNLKGGEIDNLIFFNNDKKILIHLKDKNLKI